MVVLNKIYTKTGDSGETSLGDGTRVAKHALRVHVYGSVDELNSFLGLARTEADKNLDKSIGLIQNDLFDLGGDLCFPVEEGEKERKYPPLRIKQTQIDKLEKRIDHYNADLTALNSFILPGGSEASSLLHLSRTIARRAERDTSLLSSEEEINMKSLTYLNRLSDLLFVLCRVLNENGLRDILWIPGLNQE